QWGRFREQLFATVLPRTEQTGVAMHFDNDDYFLYYNNLNQFEARLIIDKPADYTISESIGFEEFMRRGLPQLELFLREEGIEDRIIVFSTGDVGAYSLPFLFVNLDLPIAVFVRYAPEPKDRLNDSSGTQAAQVGGHLAQSHLGGMVLRPVSSVFKLFVVATEAATETVRPVWLTTLDAQPIPEITNKPTMDREAWEARLDDITGRPATSGSIQYLIDGEEYFTRLIDVLTTAADSILIRTYIFDNDDVAEMIGKLLRRRAEEGVDVKVLLDGLGTIVATRTEHESAPEDYIPPESVRRFLEDDSDIDVRQVRNPWLVAGDHVKTTIVDNRIAFTGGMNIGREYRYAWHDMMMEVQGPVVNVLTNEFYDAWAHAGLLGDIGYLFHKMMPNSRQDDTIGHPMRVLLTEPGNAEIFRVQREAIRNAQSYIYIENAYFADDTMLYELARARRRGVDVRVIMPIIGNHGPMNKSNALAANAMLEHGIRVFLYPGMSHVKAAVFDGWACFGSANWDNLSFHTNKELNLATSDKETVDNMMERLFDVDFGRSVELTEPFPERWSDYLMEVVVDYLM
ncbi:MAG: phosphatidylserine/phosphatidylglycerophosphate/cardiolipin synthase family protein, partial [Gammaproteobacteria bacterium]|nr:phosphatidylserine/phosphatidylglycerophosphate/cardiolipin synthase family protein [Gammaproteobacteria bacterium]